MPTELLTVSGNLKVKTQSNLSFLILVAQYYLWGISPPFYFGFHVQSQLKNIYSKSTIETLKKSVKYIQVRNKDAGTARRSGSCIVHFKHGHFFRVFLFCFENVNLWCIS